MMNQTLKILLLKHSFRLLVKKKNMKLVENYQNKESIF